MLDLVPFVVLFAHGVAVIGNIGYGFELERIVKGSFGQWRLALGKQGPGCIDAQRADHQHPLSSIRALRLTGPNAEQFEAFSVLILSTSAFAAAAGLGALKLSRPRQAEPSSSSLAQRLASRLGGATRNQLATVAGLGCLSAYCQYHALSHVSL